jgi:hypothetical protein
MEQFVSLAHSRQGQTIQKLVINDTTRSWPNQEHLFYFLQYLDKNNCQLKTIDIIPSGNKRYATTIDSDKLFLAQILDYVPSLQRLTAPCVGTKESNITTYFQTTNRLTYLALDLCQLDTESLRLEYNAQQYIQDMIYSSPLLRSFTIRLHYYIDDVSFDLRCTKLTCFKCFSQLGDTIKVFQNNQTRWYRHSISESNPKKHVLEQMSQNNDTCCFILYLPLTIHKLTIHNIKYPL